VAKKKRFLTSVRAAWAGLIHAFRSEKNMKIHGVCAILVILFAAWFHVSRSDWVILLLLIFLVFAFELMNTAVERTVDLCTQYDHPLARQAKDVAAGAVLVVAVASAIIGVIIFSRYLF
jgi:undecaprenol kinase